MVAFSSSTRCSTSMRIRDARSLPAISQEDLRRKAIKAVLDGNEQVEVAKILGVTRQAVGKWVKAYREGGSHLTETSL